MDSIQLEVWHVVGLGAGEALMHYELRVILGLRLRVKVAL
jgi:hypothetical protein